MEQVVIGIVGSRLDSGTQSSRWHEWRPTVAICQQEDLLIDRFELLYLPDDRALGEQLRNDIGQVSPETKVHLRSLQVDNPWDFESVYDALFDFASGQTFDLDRQKVLIHITTGTHVQQICLFLLCESRHLPGQLLQASPPTRTAKGPSGTPRRGVGEGSFSLIDLDLSKYDRIAARFEREHSSGSDFLKSGIATRSPSYNRLIDRIERVAIHSSAPVLLTGPTGAGKTRLARRIYELKKHRGQIAGRLVDVNCATIRGDGAMSTLFGHTKGAFTGATHPRAGLLKEADGGMLFLDEIGELGRDEQAMLLRAIEEQRYLPVGADQETASRFLLIAGTNRDLHREVEAGRFREDLLARINLWTFELPSLAERPEDIEPNLDYELERFSLVDSCKVTIGKEAREAFLKFARSAEALWQGNFRDLTAAVTRMATLSAGGRITKSDVDEEIERLKKGWRPVADARDIQGALSQVFSQEQIEAIDRFDAVQLAEVIKVCRTSKSLSDAGRTLFAISRQQKKQPNDADRLRKFLARFKITFEELG